MWTNDTADHVSNQNRDQAHSRDGSRLELRNLDNIFKRKLQVKFKLWRTAFLLSTTDVTRRERPSNLVIFVLQFAEIQPKSEHKPRR